MRTTLSIDDDVLDAAKERARREGRTTGQVLSDLARQALTQAAQARHTANGFAVLPRRGRPVTNTAVERLREEEGV
jgi:hypothetical protein